MTLDAFEDELEAEELEELNNPNRDERAFQGATRWSIIAIAFLFVAFLLPIPPSGDSFCAPRDNGFYDSYPIPEGWDHYWRSPDGVGMSPLSGYVEFCKQSHSLWSYSEVLGFQQTMESWLANEDDFKFIGQTSAKFVIGFLPEVVGWPAIVYWHSDCSSQTLFYYGPYHAITLFEKENSCQ